MKKCFFLLMYLTSLSINIQAQTKIKIACIGNSITYGYDVANREKNAYPAQLQALLGQAYEVKNFGVSGSTLLKNGNYPYWTTKEYTDALNYKADVYFIKLGTNDSKLMNRKFYASFENDLTNFVQSFKQVSPKARIILLLPVPSFYEDSNSIYDPIIRDSIIPFIRNVAYKTNLEVIDLYFLFIDKQDLIADKVHPSSIGANIIAQRVFEVLQLKNNSFNAFKKIKTTIDITSFYGFECASFIFNGHKCKIVKPKRALNNLPWIWRAKFFGHEAQTDIALLERGFHVMYCEIDDLFGNQKATNIWDSFYTKICSLGFPTKAVLEAMSIGGVYAYNWAASQPNKVACVYADAPVLDLNSYPRGNGKSKQKNEVWQLVKQNFNATSDEAFAKLNTSPLHKIESIVKGKFPMLHVVGDSDIVVPVEENTEIFEQKINQAGGEISVIHKKNIGHHPHSLPNPSPIVDFILTATKHKINFAAIPTPGFEYRSGAGWTEGSNWWAQHDEINACLMKHKNIDIIFVGNSITQGLGGSRQFLNYKPGYEAFAQIFKNYTWEAAGIAGDQTQQVLWRLQNGAYKKANPKAIVLTIGVNNFGNNNANEIIVAIKKTVLWVCENIPHTKIILCGPLPAGIKSTDFNRIKYKAVHQGIQKLQINKNIIYKNFEPNFTLSNGVLNQDLYSSDGIHLLSKGYELWATELLSIIKKNI